VLRVGYERIEETEDPEMAINRALKTYLKISKNNFQTIQEQKRLKGK